MDKEIFHIPGRKNQYCEHDYTTKMQSTDSMWSLSNYQWHFSQWPKSQSSLEKEEWSWMNQPSWLQIILKSYSDQDSMVLAQKQKYIPMEQGSPEINSRTYGCLIFEKEARIYNGAKTASSINGTGKTGELHVKEWK